MATTQKYETGIAVEDFYKDKGDYKGDKDLAFEYACSEKGEKKALKTFKAEAKELGVKVRKVVSIEFLEFDSSNLSHACAYWLVTYEGSEFPEG